ncbi:MAG TPA: hypothetical protein VFI46_14005 [Jiangellaceae bacterium]|nr:hypothetical protein [Jiangellaceae bacterium]
MEIYTDAGKDAHRHALDKLSDILNSAIANTLLHKHPQPMIVEGVRGGGPKRT